jgi:hypothetical protein
MNLKSMILNLLMSCDKLFDNIIMNIKYNSMKTKLLYFLILLAIMINTTCGKDDGSKYRKCDSCFANICDGNGVGDFCTFGYKWGSQNPFSKPGLNRPGPGVGDITLTYKFMDAGFVFSTHSEENLTSLSFENNICADAKEKFRAAFKEWSSVSKINFKEVEGIENSDVKVIVANLSSQSSLGYGNYNKSPCTDIRGLVIFRRNNYNCNNIYGAMLHEIGHLLGLGHVNSKNVMHPRESTNYSKLQSGDIKGVQSIYGAR